MQHSQRPVSYTHLDVYKRQLLFNVYPASVFMGDTGSLALGGDVYKRQLSYLTQRESVPCMQATEELLSQYKNCLLYTSTLTGRRTMRN